MVRVPAGCLPGGWGRCSAPCPDGAWALAFQWSVRRPAHQAAPSCPNHLAVRTILPSSSFLPPCPALAACSTTLAAPLLPLVPPPPSELPHLEARFGADDPALGLLYNQLALWSFADGQYGDAVDAARAAQQVWVSGQVDGAWVLLQLGQRAAAWNAAVGAALRRPRNGSPCLPAITFQPASRPCLCRSRRPGRTAWRPLHLCTSLHPASTPLP